MELKDVSIDRILDELARRNGGDIRKMSTDDLVGELISRNRANTIFVEPYEIARLKIKGPATVLTIFDL